MNNHEGIGNKKIAIGSNSVSNLTVEDIRKSFISIEEFTNQFESSTAADPIREKMGYAFVVSPDKAEKHTLKSDLQQTHGLRLFSFSTPSSDGVITYGLNLNLQSLPNELTAAGSGKTRKAILDDLSASLNSRVNGITYDDYYHEFNTPAVESEDSDNNNVPRKMFLKSKVSYNYYHDKYEKFLKNSSVKENLLPNVYNFISENITGRSTDKVRYQNTLAGRLDIAKNPLVRTPKAKNFSEITNAPLDKYLRDYAILYEQLTSQEVTTLMEQSRNVVTPLIRAKEFQSQSSKKDFFPTYIKIEFAKSKKSEFVEVLRTSKKEDEFVTNLIDKLERNNYTTSDFNTIASNLDGTTSQITTPLKSWNVLDLLDITPEKKETQDRYITFLGDEHVTNNLDTSPSNSIFNSLVDVAFNEKYDNFIKSKKREIEQFLFTRYNKPAYSETVVYRIAKFENSLSDTPIKNYYILNTDNSDILDFYDTQVKINKNYVYAIYAYTLVVGNEYKYENFINGPESIEFSITNTASAKLIEHMIGTVDNNVLSEPPMFPDINPYTFFDVDNKVGFNFNATVGKRVMNPVTFNSAESDRVQKLKKAQNRTINPNNMIIFSGDTPNRFYEVYRTENPPISEQSFAESLRTRTSKTSFIDTIEPNKKYYYLFRAIDNHGNVSNPSSVIQVQIIKDRAIFAEIMNYTYDSEKNTKNKTKTFKKYFRIIPSSPNLLLDLVKSGIQKEDGELNEGAGESGTLSVRDIINPYLGVGENTIWGKKFKLRITSKSSGKKLDVNFRMKQKYRKPNEELI